MKPYCIAINLIGQQPRLVMARGAAWEFKNLLIAGMGVTWGRMCWAIGEHGSLLSSPMTCWGTKDHILHPMLRGDGFSFRVKVGLQSMSLLERWSQKSTLRWWQSKSEIGREPRQSLFSSRWALWAMESLLTSGCLHGTLPETPAKRARELECWCTNTIASELLPGTISQTLGLSPSCPSC